MVISLLSTRYGEKRASAFSADTPNCWNVPPAGAARTRSWYLRATAQLRASITPQP